MNSASKLELSAIKVNQWLHEWDNVHFGENRKKPKPFFYVFSINANMLKRLSKVYPRMANEKREVDIGVQRKHDPDRSAKIRQYAFGGFPWSDLPESKRNSTEYSDLKMPGWLPTAIIANILAPETTRGGNTLSSEDAITIKEGTSGSNIILPKNSNNKQWVPNVSPIEIIDGQHRLWAFEKDEILDGEFELPVVAFYDLDISWQAYLFYTINIKPKKINASLAFDLYPILRVQDWLERSPDGAFVYKETRAQELVEALWSYETSPWRNRINMLGEKFEKDKKVVMPTITQAAFIRNLIASFIKTSASQNLGGLFCAPLKDGQLLFWNRTQQSAFLIYSYEIMQNAVKECTEDWAKSLRAYYKSPQGKLFEDELQGQDAAFSSKLSMLATDQGVRGFLHIINDMVYIESEKLKLNEIPSPDEIKEDRIDHVDIKKALTIFRKSNKLKEYLESIATNLLRFDWRTASTEGLSTAQRQKQMIYKGSSGYKEIRRELLNTLVASKSISISKNASIIMKELKYAN